MNVLKTDDWHEELGNCLFFHFDDKCSPPTVMCGSPLDDVFDEDFWTHFVADFDFNQLFDKTI